MTSIEEPKTISDDEAEMPKSLCIPIDSSSNFIEIFPEEISSIPASQLISILQDENAPLSLWTESALMYMTNKRERDSTTLLSSACSDLVEKQNLGSREERTRVLAATGIAYLTQANKGGTLGSLSFPGMQMNSSTDSRTPQQREATGQNEEIRQLADNHFTRASKLNQLFPMTWIGRGMLNLSVKRLDQAKFFFDTTLKQCGQVLPALLGMACVHFKEGNYQNSLDMYSNAISLFPKKSGAAARVGLGLACYKLGQVDRAKAAFQRAHEMDPENVEAMVGIAVLDVTSVDEAFSSDYRAKVENAIRLISTANLIDHSNAMVQNHLANYYFRKWTPVTGVTVAVEKGSVFVKGSGPTNLDAGDRIRLGYEFETSIVDEDEDDMMDDDGNTFKIKDAWNMESTDGLKVFKKDYDRVIALAKGAYSSTTVPEIQAESLYILARVYHVRDDMENANKFYERACKLAQENQYNLSPARFGLAQTLIWDENFEGAAGQLELVVKASPNASDAHAVLGLLKVKSGRDRKVGFVHLKKAIDLDPANADLILLEALALHQEESDYSKALERYKTAVQLMESQGEEISWIVLTNMGVLCHETKKYDDALICYERALKSLEGEFDSVRIETSLDNEKDLIRHDHNKMFWGYVDTMTEAVLKSDNEDLIWELDKNCEMYVKVGDQIRLGTNFTAEIIEINGKDMKVKTKYATDDTEENETKKKLYVRRGNNRLENLSAISIAFNMARLHETAGRTVAAVELHKAIVKRHPAYVNSFLRLACIARDCGSLANCSEWLKSACAVAPGNPEVLTLVGNLHLSLCDWEPAQRVFNQLLEQKVPNVEAYSMLSLGNIYFSNLKTAPGRYNKHLQYAADFYKRILSKDNANAFAANGLGTILAEKADLTKAKEIFNRVREISGDAIPDALLNLGHIYLALFKHPEALRMYETYMDRTRDSNAPTASKSRDEDEAEILLYIAFAYFDWARQTESTNNVQAAAADTRYKKSIHYLERAIKKTRKENLVLRYNWCMAKLALANCVLQKLTRGIRRTAQEVEDALLGLQDSLPKVQTMLQWKEEGKKVPVPRSLMNDFVAQCKQNIEVAKSHLNEERKKEAEANELRELQLMDNLSKQKERELMELEEKERALKEQEELENKAKAKMEKVSNLLQGWEQQAAQAEQQKLAKKQGKKQNAGVPVAEDENEGEKAPDPLFDDSSDEEDDEEQQDNVVPETQPLPNDKELFGDDSDSDDIEDDKKDAPISSGPSVSNKDLFGDSDDDDDDDKGDEDQPNSTKRSNSELATDDDDNVDNSGPTKKRRVVNDE